MPRRPPPDRADPPVPTGGLAGGDDDEFEQIVRPFRARSDRFHRTGQVLGWLVFVVVGSLVLMGGAALWIVFIRWVTQ